eukprot:CAMPEP_0168748478 /NCGR_PEP_ID=MMETSP0724-20121128/16198_1 /TAXON_ID=265536 /ORGANISM="Amphiprora sp., Strain CCMP467" /LENGTH=53 /DNA_ID=CAMNT_0008796311 /DNA_START=593 /DNA_END=754 /DNA_ORIENTATION=-
MAAGQSIVLIAINNNSARECQATAHWTHNANYSWKWNEMFPVISNKGDSETAR